MPCLSLSCAVFSSAYTDTRGKITIPVALGLQLLWVLLCASPVLQTHQGNCQMFQAIFSLPLLSLWLCVPEEENPACQSSQLKVFSVFFMHIFFISTGALSSE